MAGGDWIRSGDLERASWRVPGGTHPSNGFPVYWMAPTTWGDI